MKKPEDIFFLDMGNHAKAMVATQNKSINSGRAQRSISVPSESDGFRVGCSDATY